MNALTKLVFGHWEAFLDLSNVFFEKKIFNRTKWTLAQQLRNHKS